MTRFEKMLHCAAQQAKAEWDYEVRHGPYRLLVVKCFRDGYPYFRQQWSKDGKRITKTEAEKALS